MNQFYDKMFNNKGPSFDQLAKRYYEIDKHLNHSNLIQARHLQRSKYIKIDDDAGNYNSDDENKI